MLSEQELLVRSGRIRERLYRIGYAYLNSDSRAVDAVDEAVYRAYIKRRQLRDEALFETWLVRILINVLKDELRRSARERPSSEAQTVDRGREDADILNLPLREAISALDADVKSVVILKYFGGYTLAQIAGTLNIPPGTAASRLRRGIGLLRLEMEEDYGQEYADGSAYSRVETDTSTYGGDGGAGEEQAAGAPLPASGRRA